MPDGISNILKLMEDALEAKRGKKKRVNNVSRRLKEINISGGAGSKQLDILSQLEDAAGDAAEEEKVQAKLAARVKAQTKKRASQARKAAEGRVAEAVERNIEREDVLEKSQSIASEFADPSKATKLRKSGRAKVISSDESQGSVDEVHDEADEGYDFDDEEVGDSEKQQTSSPPLVQRSKKKRVKSPDVGKGDAACPGSNISQHPQTIGVVLPGFGASPPYPYARQQQGQGQQFVPHRGAYQQAYPPPFPHAYPYPYPYPAFGGKHSGGGPNLQIQQQLTVVLTALRDPNWALTAGLAAKQPLVVQL